MASKSDVENRAVICRGSKPRNVIGANEIKQVFDSGKKSIPLDWFRENHTPLKQHKKRTRWRYDYNFI